MNIYQLYYTRKGAQEAGAGWGVWGKTEGISNEVCEHFAGVKSAETVAAAEWGSGRPETALVLETDKEFAYYMNSTYSVLSPDGRGNMFFHGYAMGINDLFELLRKPEQVTGIADQNFVTVDEELILGRDKAEKILPLVHQFEQEKEFAKADLWKKYGFTKETFHNLMKGVYGYLANGKPFCIVLQEPPARFREAAKEIMYCIYRALPYDLRILVSYSSFQNPNGKIYFSAEKDSAYYYDAATGEVRADYVKWEDYPFLEACMQGAAEEMEGAVPGGTEKLEACYIEMNRFVEKVWNTPANRKAVTFDRMQMAYDAVVRDIPKKQLPLKLKALLEREADNHEQALDDHCAYLVETMSDCGMEEELKAQMRGLMNRVRRTRSQKLKRIYATLFVIQYCGEPSKRSFETLYGLKEKSSENYTYILKILLKERQAYLAAYYEKFLYAGCADMQELRLRWQETPEFRGKYRESLVKTFGEAYEKCLSSEILAAGSNEERYEICREADGWFLKHVPDCEGGQSRVRMLCKTGYWKFFQMKEFTYQERKQYIEMSMLYGQEMETEQKVKQMLQIPESVGEGKAGKMIYRTLIQSKTYGTNEERAYLLKEIKRCFREENRRLTFDLLALCNYSFENEMVNFPGLLLDLQVSKKELELRETKKSAGNSEFLQKEAQAREELLRETQQYLKKNKKQRETKVYQVLAAFVDCFTEKRSAYDTETEAEDEPEAFFSVVMLALHFSSLLFLGFRILYLAGHQPVLNLAGMALSSAAFALTVILNYVTGRSADGRETLHECMLAYAPDSYLSLAVIFMLYGCLTVCALFAPAAWAVYLLLALHGCAAVCNVVFAIVKNIRRERG